MFFDPDGSHSGTSTTVRNTKCFVEVQVANVRTQKSGTRPPGLSIHIRTVHIDLTAIVVNQIYDLLNVIVKNAESRWVGDHQA